MSDFGKLLIECPEYNFQRLRVEKPFIAIFSGCPIYHFLNALDYTWYSDLEPQYGHVRFQSVYDLDLDQWVGLSDNTFQILRGNGKFNHFQS